PGVQLTPEARLINLRSNVRALRVGENTVVRGELLVLAHGGALSIGRDCYVGEGSRIWSAHRVQIGNRVLISHNCDIHDWNGHSLVAGARARHFQAITHGGHPGELDDVRSAPVRIEDDVWIGFGAAVLKGVRIGRGSVVAAHSVVVHDVPEAVLVGGNPARVLRSLETQEPPS
ncbi:MAG: acyltransferase, partial [Polyangiales bacterium]